MQRYNSIHEMVGHTIELYSELETGKPYTIEGNELTYLGTGEGDQHNFGHGNTPEQSYSTDDLQQLIDAGDVKTVGNPGSEQTVAAFPHLDRFTRNTFGAPTQTLWDASPYIMDDTDLYTLEELVQRYGLQEMPLPGEGKYPSLLNDEHWDTLKHYLKAISPDIDLPEELG